MLQLQQAHNFFVLKNIKTQLLQSPNKKGFPKPNKFWWMQNPRHPNYQNPPVPHRFRSTPRLETTNQNYSKTSNQKWALDNQSKNPVFQQIKNPNIKLRYPTPNNRSRQIWTEKTMKIERFSLPKIWEIGVLKDHRIRAIRVYLWAQSTSNSS